MRNPTDLAILAQTIGDRLRARRHRLRLSVLLGLHFCDAATTLPHQKAAKMTANATRLQASKPLATGGRP